MEYLNVVVLCDFIGNVHIFYVYYQTGNYLFKVNNRNTRTRCEICSKLTIKTEVNVGWVQVYKCLLAETKQTSRDEIYKFVFY